MENRIAVTLSDADRDAVLQLIQDIRAKLPFLIDLTIEERQSLAKMGDKRRSFVSNALALAEQDDSYLPRSFDIPEMRKDVELTQNLYPISVALTQLAELIDDTYTLAGSEAYAGGLVVYQSATRNGRGSGLNELVDALGKSFARKSKDKPAEGEGEGENK